MERELRYIQIDNDGKYKDQFEKYCRDHAMRPQKTMFKISQHSGIADKMNHTICGKN